MNQNKTQALRSNVFLTFTLVSTLSLFSCNDTNNKTDSTNSVDSVSATTTTQSATPDSVHGKDTTTILQSAPAAADTGFQTKPQTIKTKTAQ